MPSENQAGRLPTMVLHVLNSASGGAALSTLALIHEFRKQGIRGCAVCDLGGTDADRAALAEAVEGRVAFTKLYWTNRKIRSAAWKRPIHEMRQLLQTGFQRGSTNKVVELARRYNADLIHTNTIVTSEGALAARRLGLPHVWHVRELAGKGTPCPLWIEGEELGQFLAAHASKVIANSHASAAPLRPLLPEGLLEVVPNGIDMAPFGTMHRASNNGRIVVGMVASLTSRIKKHALFVEAAALVDRTLPIEWRIFGHDPSQGGTRPGDAYTDNIYALIAKHGLQDRFRAAGYVGDAVEIMSRIDVLVHPANEESFGRVVVEAMAAGLPVVGARGGGVAEIVDDGVTGLLCEPDNPREMAARIEQVIRDPHRAQTMGAAGRQRAASNYSLAACAAGVLRVYEMAMNQAVAGAPQPRFSASSP